MRSNQHATSLLAAFAAVLLLTLNGCGYGQVSSTGYQYAQALYSLSNRQSVDRIDAVQAQINAGVESGELPAKEAAWLLDICEQCREGDWESAQANARRMMDDQVKP